MLHEDLNTDDQIAPRGGPGGAAPGPRIPAPVSAVTSRKDFTQHQLFAVLALKTFLKVDYRGVVAVLKDFAELRDDLGFTKKVPHPSTLCYAEGRLLKGGSSSTSSKAPSRPHAKPN